MSNPTHWLMFNEDREVVGCHCGFVASEEDEGYGDSVVDHLLVVEMTEYREAIRGNPETRWWNVEHFVHDMGDWIRDCHEWPRRRFNPLNVPLHITHAEVSE